MLTLKIARRVRIRCSEGVRQPRSGWAEAARQLGAESRKTGQAQSFLEGLVGGRLTLGAALSAIRESEGESLAAFSARLGISRSHLCDVERGRRVVSPERAARFAEALKQHQAQFVRLALQDQVHEAGLCLRVELHPA
jgi:DNA-binding transcriptional regulator YiaG